MDNIEKMKLLLGSVEDKVIEHDRFFELSPDLLCIADGSSMMFKTLSDSWHLELGWSLEELKTKPYINFVHPDDIDDTEVASEEVSSGVKVNKFINRYKIKSGGWATLEWNTASDPETGFVFAVARIISKTD